MKHNKLFPVISMHVEKQCSSPINMNLFHMPCLNIVIITVLLSLDKTTVTSYAINTNYNFHRNKYQNYSNYQICKTKISCEDMSLGYYYNKNYTKPEKEVQRGQIVNLRLQED